MRGFARGEKGRRCVAAVALVAVLAVAACGSTEQDIRDHLDENYELVDKSDSYATYRSDDPPEHVGARLSSVARPGRNHREGDELYMGYEKLMVRIQQKPATGGSEIEVTNARDGYSRWGPTIIPIWGTFGGGYSSAFSGGGPGFGK
ncbi:DUF4247 domain-containing protein [Actinobacteria bacterium YIM 96077]|uniref:DUF4247 domain-containing protein n=1 Tax=Phytoactinopolyspora halophila TaxID=1981511 RepID=A0A329QKQ4_9ACTN|nr:DUF4247 domain-containing protein [Phytoactinopolyspora halophila]AYY13086.1 DUF4247 domain-containing protein [Actinobacteria bacterium YIM 96077]RAW11098.1 hypothetical protein DPM12_17285 [Phytoactinopolyspora halophila]